jgi:hypothetical protein
MSPARRKDQVFVATDSGHTEINGVPYAFHKGVTRVREGHPITKIEGFENIFEPIDASVHYDVEQATASPGEKRGE